MISIDEIKKFRRVLTEKDKHHLINVVGVHSFEQFKRSRKVQLKMKTEYEYEPCSDCAEIARKLGLEN